MGVYEIVPQPKGRKVVGSKWVFRIKHGPDGNVKKYKAHMIAQGFTQVEGLDFNETFAPITKFSSFHTILILAAEHNLEFHKMDVKAAYLNGVLKGEIYMEPLPGLEVPEGMVFHLIKAVYGTKQGGRVWYLNIKKTLEEMCYRRLLALHSDAKREVPEIPEITENPEVPIIGL